MPPIFFQHYWQNISGDISRVVLSILNLGKIPVDLNHMYLTPIPKIKCPERVSYFQPIALCDILYKVVLKVLARKFCMLLFLNPRVPFNLTRLSRTIFLRHLRLFII